MNGNTVLLLLAYTHWVRDINWYIFSFTQTRVYTRKCQMYINTYKHTRNRQCQAIIKKFTCCIDISTYHHHNWENSSKQFGLIPMEVFKKCSNQWWSTMTNCWSSSLSDPYASVYLCRGATLAFATYYYWFSECICMRGILMVFGCCHCRWCCCFWFYIYFITMLAVCAVHTRCVLLLPVLLAILPFSAIFRCCISTLPLCKQSAFRNAILHNLVSVICYLNILYIH